MYSKDGTATVEYDCSTLLKAGRFRDPRLYPSFFTDGKVLPTPAGLFLFILARVLNVGFIGYVGVSRDRIVLWEAVSLLGRVLDVGCIGNLGVCASQNRNIGSYEGNGNNVSYTCHFERSA